MTKKKLPAYARALLEARRRGEHPEVVNLCYGDRWRAVSAPSIAIDPKEYEPGKYDFHVLAGLKVVVVDQLAGGFEIDETVSPPVFGKFFDLLREVAAFDTWIVIEWPQNIEPRHQDACDVAWTWRRRDPAAGKVVWPAWWSEEINEMQFRRARQCLREMANHTELERGRAAA